MLGLSMIMLTACATTTKQLEFKTLDRGITKVPYVDPDKIEFESRLYFLGFNGDKSQVYLWDSDTGQIITGCGGGGFYSPCEPA